MTATQGGARTSGPAAERAYRWFPGWTVVGAVFVMNAVTSGLGFYALSVYLEAITDERGLSTGQVSGATAVFFITGGLVGVVVGRMIAHSDLRVVVAVGAVVGAGALVLVGRAAEAWQVYGAYVVFAVGFGCAGLLPGTTLVTRWFHRRRSVALSISSTGLSVGGLVVTPQVSRLIDNRGFEDAAPVLAVVWFVVLVAALWFLSPDPARRGLRPDNDPAPEAGSHAATAGPRGARYVDAVRSRFFRCITAGMVLAMAAQVGAISHLFKLVRERVDRPTAALAVSCLAGASVCARLLGGIVATRVPMTTFTVAMAVGQGAGVLLLGQLDGKVALLAAAVVFGTTVGNLLMLHPLLIAEGFGVREYPKIFSTSQLWNTAGIAGGPLLLGLVHDAASYRWSYSLSAALSVGAAVLFSAAGSTERTAAAHVGD